MAKWDENSKEVNWNKITTAVDLTKGKVITYEGKPIDAFFHSNSGGMTETVSNVWGGSDLPYLQSVQTAGEDGYTQYESEVQFTKDELIDKIKTKYQEIELNFNEENNVQIIE